MAIVDPFIAPKALLPGDKVVNAGVDVDEVEKVADKLGNSREGGREGGREGVILI